MFLILEENSLTCLDLRKVRYWDNGIEHLKKILAKNLSLESVLMPMNGSFKEDFDKTNLRKIIELNKGKNKKLINFLFAVDLKGFLSGNLAELSPSTFNLFLEFLCCASDLPTELVFIIMNLIILEQKRRGIPHHPRALTFFKKQIPRALP